MLESILQQLPLYPTDGYDMDGVWGCGGERAGGVYYWAVRAGGGCRRGAYASVVNLIRKLVKGSYSVIKPTL